MKKFILEQQLGDNQDPSSTDTGGVDAAQSCPPYATTLTLDACKCRHLQKWLPHVLNLSCVPGGTSWTMANPVHALHLASHLEPDGSTVYLPKGQPYGEPALYGEEHSRTSAITSQGISHSFGALARTEQDSHPYTTRTVQAIAGHAAAAAAPTSSEPPQGSVPSSQQPINTVQKIPGNVPSAPSTLSSQLKPQTPAGPVVPASTTSSSSDPLKTAPISNSSTGNAPTQSTHSASATAVPSSEFHLSEDRFNELRRREELILQQRRLYLSKRKSSSDAKRKMAVGKKKKVTKEVDAAGSVSLLPRSLLSSFLGTRTVIQVNQDAWEEDARLARCNVEEWMERFRQSRQEYWEERQRARTANTRSLVMEHLQCQQCNKERSTTSRRAAKKTCVGFGDELMQCLECSFVGCSPRSLFEDSQQHIVHHSLKSGHTFAVTCGERAQVFCFKCGDFVYHEIFDQEKERIDISRRLPWMGWKVHPVQRSFDAMQFLKTTDHGVVWRGLVASYPPLVPKELIAAARLSMRRLSVFQGELLTPSLAWGAKALEFAVYREQQDTREDWRIHAPVGMYNLGNTCFMTSIMQCLIHCVPLQRHFLKDIGHHHKSCEVIRNACAQPDNSTLTPGNPMEGGSDKSPVCLACELDRLFLQYFGRTVGKDVTRAVCESPNPMDRYGDSISAATTQVAADLRGEPLVITDLLAAAWKTGGMDHLAGYEQRDAHEFVQAFLDTMGKQVGEYRKLIRSMQNAASENRTNEIPTSKKQESNIIKQLFEGTLRSVLVCEECGCKRSLPESFLNVSLPLSKHLSEDADGGGLGTRASKSKISLQRCLEQFTAPESLADPVDCPSCRKKTPTKKQHTFAKLPKVLCLHLKRFDAAKNRKIADFVSFPAYGLDMGPLLPHWRETGIGIDNPDEPDESITSPHIMYDLFASANHTGTLHQGHYVANVKVQGQWYHCNDAHVSKCEDEEEEVLHSDGAYVLFYIRR